VVAGLGSAMAPRGDAEGHAGGAQRAELWRQEDVSEVVGDVPCKNLVYIIIPVQDPKVLN